MVKIYGAKGESLWGAKVNVYGESMLKACGDVLS